LVDHRSTRGDRMSKNWQTVMKRDRERAVEQKRTLKRERKRAAAAERAAKKNGLGEPEHGVEEPEAAEDDVIPA